jgi:hypothetical protein
MSILTRIKLKDVEVRIPKHRKLNLHISNININFYIGKPSEIKIKNYVHQSDSLFDFFNNDATFNIAVKTNAGDYTLQNCRIYSIKPSLNNAMQVEEAEISAEKTIFGKLKRPMPPIQTFIFR